jgi:hypothetical protein
MQLHQIDNLKAATADLPLCRRLWLMVVQVALFADTTTIRIILANASALWVVAAIADPGAFDRPGFVVMAHLAPMWVWAIGFLLHFAGVYWRLFDPISRPIWALAVNAFGFFLWFTSTAAINLALGTFTPGSALEWTLCGASAWALYRTGLHREIVTP